MLMTRSAAKFWWGNELPKEVAYLKKEHLSNDWIEVTYNEIKKVKIQQQDIQLNRKRTPDFITKPAYVWVFKNEFWAFGGWWIYIKTLNKDYGISFKHEYDKKMILKAMELFPMGVFPMLENFELWAELFANKYACNAFNRTKNQGIAKCYVDINWKGIIDIKKY